MCHFQTKKLKAPGWDLIQNEHLIYGGKILKTVLCRLYNSIMELEVIPDSWKRGIIVPIYKGHNKSKSALESYRPVTLLSVILKVFEKVLHNRITLYLSKSNIIFPNIRQQGFQTNFSCITAAYTVQEVIQYNLDQGSCTYAAFMDIKRAFDTVWHNALFVKLHDLGIQGKMWRILMELYNGLQSSVNLNRKLSQWFPVKQGVRQGGVLSTFLYLDFMNDLLEEIQTCHKGSCIGTLDCSCPVYADDMAYLANSPKNLQKIVTIAYKYSCKNRFEFHPEKSFVIIFGRSHKAIAQQIHIKLGSCRAA